MVECFAWLIQSPPACLFSKCKLSNSVDGFSGRCAIGMKDDDEFVVVDTKKKGQREESRRSTRQECSDND